MFLDLVIEKGQVIDGTGNSWLMSDIGISNDRIVGMGDLSSTVSKEKIDATGLVIAPGFIDIHSHGDLALFTDPSSRPKIMQGVTTEVIGNCGFSAAPVTKKNAKLVKEFLSPVSSCGSEVPLNWSSMNEYLDSLQQNKIAVNVAPLVGHGTIRVNVVGNAERSPTENELAEMKCLLTEALADGAFGMSSGLIYPPASYSSTDELIELCKIVRKFNGIYASHIRGEGRSTLLKAMKEAVEIGAKSNVPVEISHQKACGRDNWGNVRAALDMIDQARNGGLDVTCDVYPYTAGSTVLRTLLPYWVLEGGREKMIERLNNEETRKKIRVELETESELKTDGAENVIVSSHAKEPELLGKTLEEVAIARSRSPYEILMDLLIGDPNAQMIIFEMDEDDVRAVIRHKRSMIGSDGLGVPGIGNPHPRLYGTFPRVLARYVREEKLLTIEDAIRKMTSFPASKLGLRGRGTIAEGMFADIVIFDDKDILDAATFENPHQFARGVRYVLVNGKVAVRESEYVGVRAGRVLRKSDPD